MEFEMDKILDLDYLRQCLSDIDNEIHNISTNSLLNYDFDTIISMTDSQLEELFAKYNIDYSIIRKYKDSVEIDNSEFSDLFPLSNSISISNNEVLKNKVYECINKLNKKIADELKLMVDVLNEKKTFAEGIISFLTIDHIVTKDDIEKLVKFIENCELMDNEKVQLSRLISKYLIDRNKSFIIPKTSVVKVSDDFEDELSKVYDESEPLETSYLNESEHKYANIINEYFKKYEEFFMIAGLSGMELDEILSLAHSMANDLVIDDNSTSKIDFVLKIANLLFVLKNTTDEIEVADVLEELKKCDKFMETSKLSEGLLIDVNQVLKSLSSLSVISADENNKTTLINELNLLVKELTENVLSSNRIKELVDKYNELKITYEKIIDNKTVFDTLINVKKTIEELINYASANNIKAYFNKLVANQANVIEILRIVDKQGLTDLSINETVKVLTTSVQMIYDKIHGTNKTDEVVLEDVNLQAFVLFDVDEKGQPYVISRDLNQRYPKNFVDDSLSQDEKESGFSDYVKLIYDLFLLGEPEIVSTNSPNMNKIIDHVFRDPENRKGKTPMKRIRPLPRSWARLVDEKIILYSGTHIYEQVVTIFKELFPWLNFSSNGQLIFYINYASGIKRKDEGLYDVAIVRYDNRNSLYKKLLENVDVNSKLTDEELNLLRELIKTSVDVCGELSKMNPDVKFDFLQGNGGMKYGL